MNRFSIFLSLSLFCGGALLTDVQAVPEATPAAVPAPFMNHWLVCGPFAQAETPESISANLPAVGKMLGKKTWEFFDDRLWNRNYDNYQDLSGYYAVRKGVETNNQFVYAATNVFSPKDGDAVFRFGSSGSYRLFLNGKQIAQSDAPKEIQRDMFKQPISLKKGWNSLILEIHHDFTDDKNANGAPIAKDAAVSYLGIYGRVADGEGNAIPGVIYSTIGGNSALNIAIQPLAASDVVENSKLKGRGLPKNILPTGYAEWPYVWNKSLYGNDNRRIWADAYQLEAGGGQPGYRFAVVSGNLPKGLTLKDDGTFDGVCEKIGTFSFTVQVTDSAGKTARKELAINVKDRPNRWFEEGRVGALSHCIAVYPFWVDPNCSLDLWGERASREGHSLVSVESLQQNYYWPSKFEDPKHPRNQFQPRDSEGKVLDGLKPAADAVRRYGMKFGLYYATEGGGLSHFSTDVFVQNCSDLIRRYDPSYLYFDGPQTMGGANYDVMYSNVRNYGDDIIINSNVWAGHGEFGDADLGTSEASHIYSKAAAARYNKRIIVEPWKSVHTKNNPTPYYSKRDDFRQIAKEMVMNAARGFVDNNDQMPIMSRGPNWDSPADIARRYPKAYQEFADVREGLAKWFSPAGLPERHESTTGTVPYFLAGFGYEDDGKGNIDAFAQGKGPDWGYATARDNAIYLHFIKGPDGKLGYTGQTSVTIRPVKEKVQKAFWLNENKPLRFQQSGESLTITLQGITTDPVDTIVKIVTDNPARKYLLTNLAVKGAELTPELLQMQLNAYATYPALKVPLPKGSVTFSSNNAAVAQVGETGLINAVSPGKAIITAKATVGGISASGSLNVVVNAAKHLRVDDPLIGAVLEVNGKEAFLSCPGGENLPFNLVGRSGKGGPVSLHDAKISLKCGVVDYAKGTQFKPVFIEENPIVIFENKVADNGEILPALVKELTRAAVWAEIDLDGQKFTTNKVFLDIEPVQAVSISEIRTSGHLGDFTPEKVNDGVAIDAGGSDRSKWSASGASPSWIAFDFKTVQKVSQVSIRFNTLEQAFINTPETMEIQVSADAKQWTTRTTVTSPASGSGAFFGFPEVYNFLPAKTRYVRLFFPKGNPKGDVDLLEVRFFSSNSSNLALQAKVSASSEADGRYLASNVIDGVIGEHGRGEWAAKDEANPWLKLEWGGKVTINRIVLFDRPHPVPHTAQGVLTFSDGSSLPVKDIPNEGGAKIVDFPAKSIEWMKFQATDNKDKTNGFSEVQVFGPEK